MEERWLFGRRLDLGVFLGAALLSLVALAIGHAAGVETTPDWAWVPAVLLVDVAHVWSTGFRVWFDPEEWRRHPVLYAGVPLLVLLGGIGLYARGGALLFWRVLAYLAVFHFVRQQVGWVVLYRARGGERDRWGSWLDSATVYTSTLVPLLYWHTHLPRRFHWFLEGDFVALPGALYAVALPIYGVLLAVYTARALVSRPVNVGKHVVVSTTAVLWWVGMVTFDSDYAFTVTNVLMHGIPYIALVWVFQRHKARPLVSSPVSYLGVLWAIAYVEELFWDRGVWHERSGLFGGAWDLEPWHVLLVPLLATPQVTHYVLDGIIWRRAANPEIGGMFGSVPRP
jgi:hypothetical protein